MDHTPGPWRSRSSGDTSFLENKGRKLPRSPRRFHLRPAFRHRTARYRSAEVQIAIQGECFVLLHAVGVLLALHGEPTAGTQGTAAILVGLVAGFPAILAGARDTEGAIAHARAAIRVHRASCFQLTLVAVLSTAVDAALVGVPDSTLAVVLHACSKIGSGRRGLAAIPGCAIAGEDAALFVPAGLASRAATVDSRFVSVHDPIGAVVRGRATARDAIPERADSVKIALLSLH